MLAPSKVFGTRFKKAVVAEGCILHASEIERAVIGIRSRIGEDTIVRNAVVFGNDYYESIEQMVESDVPMGIGDNCFIENAILDKGCRIGNNVVIVGHPSLEDVETDNYCIRNGIVVLKKEAVIPNGTKVGFINQGQRMQTPS